MTIKKVIHEFSKQAKESGRAGNVFFEGRVLYSYGHHFPLAFIRGGRAFINTSKYSVSTSRQQSYTRQELAGAYELTEMTTEDIKTQIAEDSRG
jgi:hypothetical protein